MQVLIDWINDVLVGERIIVKDLAEDLYDGQVLQKLFGIPDFPYYLTVPFMQPYLGTCGFQTPPPVL